MDAAVGGGAHDGGALLMGWEEHCRHGGSRPEDNKDLVAFGDLGTRVR
jgi:hypothetical protein